MSDLIALIKEVGALDAHTCTAEQLTELYNRCPRPPYRSLSTKATAGMLKCRLRDMARARAKDPIPLHAIEERIC